MLNNIIVKDTWIMPKANEETTLTLQEPSDLLVGCWLWNPSVGYLEVTKYSGYDIYVTVKNLKMEENAREGTIFPSCMEMLVIAPNATPILDNNVTCLSADFISPEEGSTALMKVVDSSAIKAADLIIVDNKYQYVVIQVIDEHTLEVLNDGKGAEGIIKIDCTGCVSVKIFESTYCCKVLQEEVDDIYNTLNDRHSIKAWTGNNLVTISGGNDALIAPNDATIKVDNDLSKYDNSVTKFSSILNFKESANYSTANFYPDRNTGLPYYSLGNTTNYYDYAYIRQIYGPSTTQYLKMSGIATTLSGTSYVHFNVNGGGFITLSGTSMAPAYNISSGTISLGTSSKSWKNVYTDKITLNGTTYTSIPAPANNGTLTIYNSDGVTPFVEFTADASSNVTATLPAAPSPVTYTAVSPIYIDSSNNIGITRYFEEVKVGDHYFFQPIIDPDALSYNLGNSSNYFDNTYSHNIYTETIRRGNSYSSIKLNSGDGTFQFDCDQTTAHTSEYAFCFGSTSTIAFTILDHAIYTQGIYPYNGASDTYNIGTITVRYRNLYCTRINNDLKNDESFEFANVYIQCINNNTFQIKPRNNIHNILLGSATMIGSGTNGDVYVQNSLGQGRWDGTSWQHISDIKLKKNIETFDTKTVDIINELRVVTYNWNKDSDKDSKHLGFIANEVEKVIPEIVSHVIFPEEKNLDKSKDELEETLMMSDVGFIPYIVKAIQELAQDVADLKKALTKGDDNEYKEVSKEG